MEQTEALLRAVNIVMLRSTAIMLKGILHDMYLHAVAVQLLTRLEPVVMTIAVRL